jgi:hypothetical protein
MLIKKKKTASAKAQCPVTNTHLTFYLREMMMYQKFKGE